MKSLRVLLPSILLLASFSASAHGDDVDRLVLNAAGLHQPVDGYLYGQRVRAVPVNAARSRCTRVGIIYPDSRGRRGPRIDNYDACGDNVVDVNDVSPALPDNRQFREITLSTMRAAIFYARRVSDFDGYVIESQRLMPADGQGCAFVETTISSEGLLVENSAGRICP